MAVSCNHQKKIIS